MSAKPPADATPVSGSKGRAEADRVGRSFLVYRDGEHGEQLFFFEPGSTDATVGRQPSSDLPLVWDDQVSRLHARFERVRDAWELIDDGLSSNGTFVNEQRLSGRRRLEDGDALRFGTTTVIFRSPEPNGTADAAETPAMVGLSSTQHRVLVALCRPYMGRSGFASPATDQQMADELFLAVGEVRAHLRVLYAKLGIEQPRQGETRVRLVERAFSAGLISERDL